MTPIGGYSDVAFLSAEGYQPHPGERMVALSNPVTEGYLTAMGIPLLLGRDFQPGMRRQLPRGTIFSRHWDG